MSRYLNLADRFGSTVPGIPVLGRLPVEQLDIPQADISILRALGVKKHRYANDPVMETRRKLWRATNDLAMTKPPIYINEICWEEMKGEGELGLHCAHPFALELEEFLRQELYCYEHGLGDCIIDDMLESPLVVYDSGFGIDEDVDTVHTDRNSEIISRHFKPYILTMDDVEKIKMPKVYVDHERTAQYTNLMREIFDGILDVQIVGARGLWFTPWDYLIRVMGINETLYNLVDEPDFVEAVVKRYVNCAMIRMEQYRKLGIWASNNYSCRVGSGGYGLVSCLNEPEGGAINCDTLQMWGCGNAQIFSTVSPEMHWRFSLQYEMDWLKQFGITYYGCCEPLYKKMDIMDRIPNLRKISMSPWNDFAQAAEWCRGKYVMSCKPSPAKFTCGEFSDAEARKEIEDIIHQTQGCSIEIIMKDISTVDYHPRRLWRWAKIARETIDGMFD